MNTGIYVSRFGEVLSNILESSKVSCYHISQYADIDQAYLSRLKSGEKSNPSPEVMMRIGLALVHFSNEISISDVEDLFNATGRTLFPKYRSY